MAPLSSDHRLWVPMQVQALVFGEPGTARFVDLTPTYENLLDRQEAPLGAKLRPQIDADASPPFLPKGIHLHWTLPAAFTHVRPATDGNGSTLPLAPNRWLVIRLWEAAPGRLSQRSWIVESDFTHPDDAAAPWLQERNGRVEITRLGRKVALEDWTEKGTANGPLTAFAPGNLGFAAFYPSCRGVFGLHDEADDLPDGTVCTYLVAGWFSDKGADPLCVDKARPEEDKLNPEERWSQRMLQHQWAIPEGSEFWPTAVTCYGIAPGIEWTPDVECSTGQLPGVRVALGSSIIEALAALAKANGTDADRDRLVSELQLAALAERQPTRRDMQDPAFFKTLGRMLAGRAKLHERAFAARDGGSFWEIVPPEREHDSEGANARPIAHLPPDVSAQLAELNRLQREYDEAARSLDAWRGRLFAAWYRHRFWSTNTMGGASAAQIATMLADLETDKTEVEARVLELKARQDRRDDAERILRNQILPKKPDEKPELELVARAMPRFWRASDPFVLTAGLPVPVVQGGASPLQCRVSNQTIDAITVTNVPTYGTIEVTRADLTKSLTRQRIPPPAPDGVPPDFAELLLDALFTDRQRAGILARAYWQDRNRNPSDRQIQEVSNAIGTAQRTIEAASAALAKANGGQSDVEPKTVRLTGVDGPALRSLLSAIRLPSTPIRPVFMAWKASWYPHRPDASPPASDLWDLADGIDCRWKDSAAPRGGQPGVVDGFAPIATGLERGLAASREKFEAAFGFVFERLTQLAGQSLSGLTDALAARASGPQVGPLTRASTGELRVDPIADLVGNQYVAAPLPGGDDGPPFSPLRGGHFGLTRLWIVDSFGRIQRLIDTEGEEPVVNNPILSHTLAAASPDAAHLLPRLVQPARLQLRWLSAGNDKQESLGDLGTSPICGFVVHNRLDRSLLIYGAGDAAESSPGTLLGSVQAISLPHGQEAVRWSKMPVRPFDADGGGGGGPGEADIPNEPLRNFVNGLLARTGGAGTAFKAFRDLLERHEDSADRSLDQGLQAVLIGRPLAVVRASLRLELDGPPVIDQSVRHALAADRETQAPWFRALKVPVRVGDRRLGPDGLVGYFVDDGSAAAYETLRLRADEPYDPQFKANAYFGTPALEVSCDPQAEPLILTLLLDPKRGVNVISGILPASVSMVPPALLAEALSDLEVPFLVAPVLGERAGGQEPAAGRRMPLPTSGHGEWSWAFFPDAKAPSNEAPVNSDTAAAPSLFTAMALHEGWLKFRPAKGEKQ